MATQQAQELSDSWVCIESPPPDTVTDSQDLPPMLFSQVDIGSNRNSGPLSITSSKSICSCSPPLSTFSGSSGEYRPRIDIPHQQIADFIWDWSSRPEVVPPFEYEKRFKYMKSEYRATHPAEEDDVFSLTNLPRLIFSHACTFLVGAALMFLVMKKITSKKWGISAV